MGEVFHKLFLFIFFSVFIPIVAYYFFPLKYKEISAWKISAINFIIIYVLIIIAVFSYDFYIYQRLMALDLDGDGFFSGAEITEEQQKYMKLYAHGTSRTFAPITGFIYSFIHSCIFWVSLSVFKFTKRLNNKNTKK